MLPRDACPTPGVLRQVLLGQLPEADLDAVEAHLDGCAGCQQALDRLEVDGPLGRALKEQSGEGVGPDAELAEDVRALVDQLEQLTVPRSLGPGSLESSAAVTLDGEALQFLAPAQRVDELGRLAHYRVLELLGAGGMGLVFRAEDTQLQRLVALKLLRPGLVRRVSARARFLGEARAMAAVKHDNIATIFQVGEVAGDAAEPVPFLAMELLEGQSLADWLRRHGQPPWAWVARLGQQVAAGLAAAHARGLIHRDVKPANLFLEAPSGWADEPLPSRPALAAVGRVKLLDFGLAAALDDERREGVLAGVQKGEVMGTPAYMAPEQVRGEPLDGRCDLFALGCVLYELCTGKSPFRRDRRQLQAQTLDDSPPRPLTEIDPAVPKALADLVGQLLAWAPSDRPASARAVEQQLAAIERATQTADTLSDSRPPTEELTPTSLQRARARRWLPAMAAAAVLGLGLCLLLLWRPREAAPPIGQAPASATNPLRGGWDTHDIGAVGLPGSSHFEQATGAFTVAGSGGDISGTADQFRYAYQRLTGDGVIVARVTQNQNTDVWAKVGVMLRETLATDSKHVSMMTSAGNGPEFLWRSRTGGVSQGNSPGPPGPFAPFWVRLERVGDTVRGSFSVNGVDWTSMGSATVSMTATVYVGLVSLAHNNTRINVGTLDNVSVLPAGWSAGNVGSVSLPGWSHFDQATGTFTVAGSGADLWGTTDEFRYTYQRLTGDGAIVARVTQNQDTDVWAKVGVMVRERMAHDAKHVSMMTSAHNGPQFLWRASAGGKSEGEPPHRGEPFAPLWVRLQRAGDTFTGSLSSDGTRWTSMGSARVPMTPTVYIGLVSLSHNNTKINVGILEQVCILDAAALRRLPAAAP
jgi:serine/threonine protein kinase/regulation of enolase protein 1 (concanavalin A-like superfamily)